MNSENQDLAIDTSGNSTFIPVNPPTKAEVLQKPFHVQLVASQKFGANSACPCGKKRPDGKPMKYKKCCMSSDVLN